MLFRGSSQTAQVQEMKRHFGQHCTVSNLAIPSYKNNPIDNKNYRNNPSLLIQTSNGLTTVIDVGKTFREGALRWFPKYKIGSIDALILTHEHMDAAGGLDDVRGFQKYTVSQGQQSKMTAMPLFVSTHCYLDLQKRFPWLLPSDARTTTSIQSTAPLVQRHVASFDVRNFQAFEPFAVHDELSVIPLPIMHGEDLVSFGFAFTVGSTNIVYLSDISRMLPETLDFIRNKLPPTDILVLDALHETETNAVHYNLHEAMELVTLIQPNQTYLVGMSCDSFLPHDEMNQVLAQRYKQVALAHDGLEITM